MGELQPIPDKQYFRTSEVCQLTDTQPYVLRFWESEFPQLAPDRSRGGPSVYRRRDIDIVLRIKKLLYEDEFTIEGARRQLEQELAGTDDGARTAVPDPEPEPEPSRSSEWVPAAIEATDEEVVARRRYDDAVEEIELLRLRLREAEARERRADARAQRSDEEAAAAKQRIDGALARIDRLLQSLARPTTP